MMGREINGKPVQNGTKFQNGILDSSQKHGNFRKCAIFFTVGATIIFLLTFLILRELGKNELTAGDKINLENTLKECQNDLSSKSKPPWPKIFHQTWKDKNVPEKYRTFVETCKRLNPNYKYMFWTDEDIKTLIKDKYPWFIEHFLDYPHNIQRIDSGRLFIMHQYGGVYIDIDIECKASFDAIINNVNDNEEPIADVILARTDPIGITNNMLMGRPNHSFYKFLIHRLPETRGRRFTPHWTVMLSAGPIFLYRSYLIYPCKSEVKLIPTHYHSAVYFNHVQAKTWHSWDGPFIAWFDYHGRMLLNLLGVSLMLCLVYVLFMYIRNRRRQYFFR